MSTRPGAIQELYKTKNLGGIAIFLFRVSVGNNISYISSFNVHFLGDAAEYSLFHV